MRIASPWISAAAGLAKDATTAIAVSRVVRAQAHDENIAFMISS
jgi:hypothetical protein